MGLLEKGASQREMSDDKFVEPAQRVAALSKLFERARNRIG